jgi:hypothetical protein
VRTNSKKGRHNDESYIIDKKFVHLDEELEKVCTLVGEKIKVKFSKFSDQFMETVETKEAQHLEMEGRVAALEKLDSLHSTNTLLAVLVTSPDSFGGTRGCCYGGL